MEVHITYLPQFLKDAKQLTKRYRSFKEDLRKFVAEFKNNPLCGADLGGGVRKVRMAFASKGKGKSGGGRVITYEVDVRDGEIYDILFLTVYDKSEMDNISRDYIDFLVDSFDPTAENATAE